MTGTRLLALTFGLWVLLRSVTRDAGGRTLVDHLLGNRQSQSPLLDMSAYASANAGPGTAGPGGTVDPIPGATGSRLDMGMDATAQRFLAPFSGLVVRSVQSDPGWQGGGYLAIQNASNPGQVVYMAEGLSPTVTAGQHVSAGQSVAVPRSNPYNGIVGNIELGPATAGGQPLAPTAGANRRNVVLQFYNWLRSLGGPAATSTGLAGYP